MRPALRRARDAGAPVALATLYRSEGGAPLGVGAQMAITAAEIAGYLTGGCVEADVALHARAVLADGAPRDLIYGRGGPVDIHLPCGGRIDVRLELARPEAIAHLLALAAARTPALWVSDGRAGFCAALGAPAPGAAPEPAKRLCAAPPLYAAEEGGWIARRHEPRTRLIVIGHDPIALCIAAAGAGVGWEVSLVRDRGPAAPPPLAHVRYRPDGLAALAAGAIDAWTALACATHDVEADQQALAAALNTEAFYIGALGSRRRRSARLAALQELGFEAAGRRVRNPIGMNIGARTPREIAIAVIAEIIEAGRAARAPGAAR